MIPRILADLLTVALRGDALGHLQLGLGAVAVVAVVVWAAAVAVRVR